MDEFPDPCDTTRYPVLAYEGYDDQSESCNRQEEGDCFGDEDESFFDPVHAYDDIQKVRKSKTKRKKPHSGRSEVFTVYIILDS